MAYNPALVIKNKALNLIFRLHIMDVLQSNICPDSSLYRPGVLCVFRRYKPISSVSFICHVPLDSNLEAVAPLQCINFDTMLDATESSQQAEYFGAEGT